jgi:hypothetical protein
MRQLKHKESACSATQLNIEWLLNQEDFVAISGTERIVAQLES